MVQRTEEKHRARMFRFLIRKRRCDDYVVAELGYGIIRLIKSLRKVAQAVAVHGRVAELLDELVVGHRPHGRAYEG